ncbi:VWA domain-containing protein [Candidatus Poribacteria bacterium]|nr:VWA domain-containing protein [Candidatus Poribacteria bacterium]
MPVNRLMKFVELCKACGVTISPSESVAFTNDFAHITLENKMLIEEAAVACLAKDNESEAIVRKLFRLFFTGRPEEKKENSDDDHVDSQLAHALREALESGELHFNNANFEQNEEPALEQSEGMETPTETFSDIEPGPPAESNIPTKQSQHHPNIQAVPTDYSQMPDRAEIERDLAQFMHDNLSARDLERIIELLENLHAIQNAMRLTDNEGLLPDEEMMPERQNEEGASGEQAGNEYMDKQLDELTTDEETLSEQQGTQGTSPVEHPDFIGEEQDDNGESELSDQSQQNDDCPGTVDVVYSDEFGTSLDIDPGVGNAALGQSNFSIPLSLEAAQTLSAALVRELAMFNVSPPLGGRLARLMNPEQGQILARQHQMALELWMLTDQEHERLLQSLEYVVGRLLLQDCITPEEFAEYSALFDEYLKAQITIAGAGAETHLKNVAALATLLTQYKSEAPLLRVIVLRLSTAMHRLLTRRMPIYAKSAGGKLDVRKTIRQSLQYGGIPMEFIYQEKVLWEDIVLALDTSGSQAWWAVSAMLFASAFEKTARRLRVYSFTSGIEDVTKYVPHPEKFVQHLDDFAGYSNYETSFQQLLSKVPISPRTTLIIVGDCRDYQGSWQQKSPDKYGQRIGPKSAKLMGKLVTRSNKVIVLNPEEKIKWGVGDSAALDYEQAGAIVKYVASPLDLAGQLMEA